MQSVSQGWKDNQKNQLVSESFVEISLDLTNPEASSDASVSSPTALTFSNLERIVENTDEDVSSYVTLEPNLWLLDGSGKILSDNAINGAVIEDAGYVSGLIGDKDGVFSIQPVMVVLDFSEIFTDIIPGITITWSKAFDEYPTEFKVTAYNDSVVIAEKEVTGNTSNVTSVFGDISNYNKIEILIMKWCLPYHRARVENVTLGVKKYYTKKDLFSYSHSKEFDPISAELPQNTVSFEISNLNREYDPANTTGLSKYLSDNQRIEVKYGYKIGNKVEWVKAGVFYLFEWVAKENGNSAKFTAGDTLDALNVIYDEADCVVDVTRTKIEERSLYDIAEELMVFAKNKALGNNNLTWVIDDSLKNIMTTGHLPKDTVKNCLQLIANASECIMTCDVNEVIHIEKLTFNHDEYVVDTHNSYAKPEMSLSAHVKQVVVNVYSYTITDHSPNDTASGIADWVYIFNGNKEVKKGDVVVLTHDTPYVNKELTVWNPYYIEFEKISESLYHTKCLITEFGTNSPNPSLFHPSSFQYIGQELVASSSPLNITVSDSGEDITVDNPLITSNERALAVGNWVKEWVTRRQTRSLSWRADPRLDKGDMIENTDAYGTSNLLMTKIDYTYNGAFKASGEGRVI